MISILLAILSIQHAFSSGFPAQYSGWKNKCILYFDQEKPYQYINQPFMYCSYHICESQYLHTCDHYILLKQSSIIDCLKLCCSDSSQYIPTENVLEFLNQCQLDYIDENNIIIAKKNRLPIFILTVTIAGTTLLVFICFAIVYSEEIMAWIRTRLRNRGGNEGGIELQNLMH